MKSQMSSNESRPVVTARDVRRTFGTRGVLAGIDLEIRQGEFVALLGRSGTGKSTFLRALASLDPHCTGLLETPSKRAVVFQEPRLLPWKRVWKNVALGLEGDAASRKGRALAALDEVGLSAREGAWPVTLSGGEAQRVALARALVREPELLLLDEPFGALDALTKIRMHGLLSQLLEQHRPAVLLVTHDVDEAILLADRAIVLGAAPGAPLEHGSRIVADVAIDQRASLRRGDAAFAELRRQLLGFLGVDDDDASHASGVRFQAQLRSAAASALLATG
ncbi:MAG: ABC transporter ATP-binding protein [Myxococcales bacterium]|nr:MAG: ABC transporter ATP-binding protein [Myxococcales bacterium]